MAADIKSSVSPELNEKTEFLSDQTQDYNDTPLSSEGFGLSSDIASHVAQPTFESSRNSFESAVSGFKFDGLRERGLEIASSLESQAKSNPLVAAAVVGIGALAAGYILGRLLQPSASVSVSRSRTRAYNDNPDRFPAYTD